MCLKWPAGPVVIVWTDISNDFTSSTSGPSANGQVYAWRNQEVVYRREHAVGGRTAPPSRATAA